MLPPSFVDFALSRKLTDGVMIAGCAENDCFHRQGNEWTMRGETIFPAFPGPCKKRTVIKVVDADHHTMEMYFDTPDGEMKTMEIRYERAS